MSTIKSILKIAFVYIGTVMGAGFASGQEMLVFFAVHDKQGIYGIILTSLLFFVIGWIVLRLILEFQYTSYKDFISDITGEKIATIFEAIVIIFMFTCFSAMIAGCGALLKQKLEIPYIVGCLALSIICYFTFLYGTKGIVIINSFLAPVIIIGFFVLVIYIWFFNQVSTSATSSIVLQNNWVKSSVLYISYNIITAIVILITLHKYVTNKKIAFFSSLISGSFFGVVGVSIVIISIINYSQISSIEIPMVYLVSKYAIKLDQIYIIVLLAAIVTTAVSNGHGILEKYRKNNLNKKKYSIILIISGFIFAQLGFSGLVSNVYPLFGYIGLFEILVIIIFFIKKRICK